MDMLHLIDRLEEVMTEARRMPIGQGVVVDRRRILELIDNMRSTVPWEVRDAEEITANKDAILEEARREAEGVIHRAELEAQEKVEDEAILERAERQAQQIVTQGQERAQQILDEAHEQAQARLEQAEQAGTNQMDEADRYALELLRRLEQQFSAFNSTVHNGIEALESRTSTALVEEDTVEEPN